MAYRRFYRRRTFRRRRPFRYSSRTFKRRYTRRSTRLSRRTRPIISKKRKTYDTERGRLDDQLFTTQDFTVDWYLAHTGTPTIDWVFRGNSTYDPDYATGGTTATKQAQLAGRYQYYLVYGSRITVEVISMAEQTLDFTVWPSSDASAGSSDNWEFFRYAKRKTVAARNRVYSISNYARSKIILAVTNPDDSSAHSALSNANPGAQWFWHIGIRNMENTSSISATYRVKIHYYVKWFRPVTVTEA